MATLSVIEMRKVICKEYGDYPQWTNKVKRMSDHQVIAFYHSLRNRVEKGQVAKTNYNKRRY